MLKKKEKPIQVSINTLVIFASLFLTIFGNIAFFRKTFVYYPFDFENLGFIISLAILTFLVTTILILVISWKHTVKPVLVAVLMLSSIASYFMDSYAVIIDGTMIDNVLQTNADEAVELISVKLVIYIFLLGITPSFLLCKLKIKYNNLGYELLARMSLVSIFTIGIMSVILIYSATYATFFREYKIIRLYSNPAYYIYSTSKYIDSIFPSKIPKHTNIGKDAKIKKINSHRELVIFVVGETARYDRFSLNGYKKETNPFLNKENIISFTNFWSCGTSTAVSVPCMFSMDTRTSFDKSKARYSDNLIDVLNHAGVNTLWLDNNSDSKGVALRSQYVDYKNNKINPVCDMECRDIGMLANIQNYIDRQPKGDIFIVLHQMGSHGPAYYKRYPSEFEKFTPSCNTIQLEKCTQEELDNSYDNTILYTDYFLSEVIKFLKNNDEFEATMFYVSDHGESLGEKGVYLHGLPYMIAPDEQKHIPFIMWFSEGVNKKEINIQKIRSLSTRKVSHDYIFHTFLRLFEVESEVYDEKYNLL